MKKSRRKFSAKFKTKVVLEALKERMTMQELAAKYELHPNQISMWKKDFLDGAESVFGADSGSLKEVDEKEKDKLYSKIGHLQVQVDFLKKSLGE